MPSIAVVIGTFGDELWHERAKRTLDGLVEQTSHADEAFAIHGRSLAEARNEGLRRASTEHVIFLDADDSLDVNYVTAMRAGQGDVQQPCTLGVYEDGTEDDAPVLIPSCDLRRSNFLVIGSMVQRGMALEVGGFASLPVLEDWDLFIRLYLAGAVITQTPDAIYRVGVHAKSRNQNAKLHGQVYREIQLKYRQEFRDLARRK